MAGSEILGEDGVRAKRLGETRHFFVDQLALDPDQIVPEAVVDLIEMLLEVTQCRMREDTLVLPAAVRAGTRDQPAVAPERLVAGGLDHVALALRAKLQPRGPVTYSSASAVLRVQHANTTAERA